MAFYRHLISRRLLLSGCSRMSTAAAAGPRDKIIQPPKINNSASNSCSSPWLMLPPKLSSIWNSCSIDYNFYSLAGSRVVTLPHGGQLPVGDLIPINDFKFCGSSHGWLALFNRHTNEVFLYDPISRRHVTLPRLHDQRIGVTKITLSSSPDEENCRAVMIYNCNGIDDALAFCCPGRSKEWTPINIEGAYRDFVYSPRRNLFFGLNKSYEFETWDLMTSEPRMTKRIKAVDRKVLKKDRGIVSTGKVEYLVVADEIFSQDEDHVLLVSRYLCDQSFHGHTPAPLDLYAPETFGFEIDLYDEKEGNFKFCAEESLNGFTLFIGCHSDSVALRATRFPTLMPNSIYYTDPMEPTSQGTDILFSFEDFGIYDYKTKTLAVCYIPCDVPRPKKVSPSKMWFFPRAEPGV